MRAHDLIEHLKTLPPDVDVMIWHDGERYEIFEAAPVDYWDDENKIADINIKIKPIKQTGEP